MEYKIWLNVTVAKSLFAISILLIPIAGRCDVGCTDEKSISCQSESSETYYCLYSQGNSWQIEKFIGGDSPGRINLVSVDQSEIPNGPVTLKYEDKKIKSTIALSIDSDSEKLTARIGKGFFECEPVNGGELKKATTNKLMARVADLQIAAEEKQRAESLAARSAHITPEAVEASVKLACQLSSGNCDEIRAGAYAEAQKENEERRKMRRHLQQTPTGSVSTQAK